MGYRSPYCLCWMLFVWTVQRFPLFQAAWGVFPFSHPPARTTHDLLCSYTRVVWTNFPRSRRRIQSKTVSFRWCVPFSRFCREAGGGGSILWPSSLKKSECLRWDHMPLTHPPFARSHMWINPEANGKNQRSVIAVLVRHNKQQQ